MRLFRKLNWWYVTALGLGVVGLGLGLWAFMTQQAYLSLLGLTIVCSGGLAAILAKADGTPGS